MIGLVIGLAFGIGLVFAVSAFGPRQMLVDLLVFEDRASWHLEEQRSDSRVKALAAQAIDSTGLGELISSSRFSTDLSICGLDRVDFVASTAAKTLALAGSIVVGSSSPVAPVGPGPGLGLAALIVCVLPLAAARDVTRRAEERREEMVEALAAYIGFTRLAAHTQSVEGAMRAAAKMGATWPFRSIERVLHQADQRAEPPWRGLVELGRRYAIADLVELGGALEVAGVEGTKVSDMLAAKATSLRRRITENAIEAAEVTTQKLVGPMILIVLTFLVLVITPALLAF